MKPHIFRIFSAGEVISFIDSSFVWWLTVEKDYFSEANSSVISADEIRLLKKSFDESIVPYIAVIRGISGDEFNQTKKAVEKLIEEYLVSSDKKERKIDLIEIKDPENDEEFQNFLLHMLVEIRGNLDCDEKQRKMLPDYVSWFCANSKAVKTLAGQIVMDQKEIGDLKEYLPSADY